jgi:hypothetical protein
MTSRCAHWQTQEQVHMQRWDCLSGCGLAGDPYDDGDEVCCALTSTLVSRRGTFQQHCTRLSVCRREAFGLPNATNEQDGRRGMELYHCAAVVPA